MHACDAVDEARDLAGWEPPPELDAAIVTEVDGLPLMLNPSSTTGYKHVTRRLNMTYRVAPPDSFPANTRTFLKGATYATALRRGGVGHRQEGHEGARASGGRQEGHEGAEGRSEEQTQVSAQPEEANDTHQQGRDGAAARLCY